MSSLDSLQQIARLYPYNVWAYALGENTKIHTIKDDAVLKAVILIDPVILANVIEKNLKGRQKEAVHLYFRDGLTFEEVGKELKVTGERTRVIIYHATGKLRFGSSCKQFRLVSILDYQKTIQDMHDAENHTKPEIERPKEMDLDNFKDGHLSTRAYNNLVRNGYYNLMDFVGKTPTDIRNLEGIGPVTEDEIVRFLRSKDFYVDRTTLLICYEGKKYATRT